MSILTNIKLNYVICNIKDLLINREYIVIPIIPMGGYLKLNINQFVYNTTTLNINAKKFLNRMECKKKRIIT